MHTTDLDSEAVAAAVAAAPSSFRTKDVSKHPLMLAAHPEPRHARYHRAVGEYLSEYRSALGIHFESKGGPPHGACWSKTASLSPLAARRLAPAVVCPPSASPGATATTGTDKHSIGPQCDDDDPFTARMRFHQSWYRAHVLKVPCGTGPKPASTAHLGSMLRCEDGSAGRNFLTKAIFDVVTQRLRFGVDGVEPFRVQHNMLSSQPMCFNIFGPLVVDRELATRLLRAVFPRDIARVIDVVIEHAPSPAREYLDDGTSFDAFVDYESPSRRRGFLAIETKLTDTFSPRRYDTEAYRRCMQRARAVWLPGVDQRVTHSRHNQLWRNHLLAIATRSHVKSPYATCRSIVLRHSSDKKGAAAVRGYRELLADGEPSFAELTLDVLVRGFEQSAHDAESEWLSALRARYVDLDGSASRWAETRRGSRPSQ